MNMQHGRSECRKCFEKYSICNNQIGDWKIQNDPCYWGGSNPDVLVLGFSKGFTQANAYKNDCFENIPFKGMRPRLTASLRALDLLACDVDDLVADPHGPIGFASLVRCSVARLDEKRSEKYGKKAYNCTGPIIGKSFIEIPRIVTTCARQHLTNLPQSVRVIVMLGNGDQYIRESSKVISEVFPLRNRNVNHVAMVADGRLWVWTAHPSGLNGHFNNWIYSVGTSGRKFRLAQEAITDFSRN